MGSINCVLSSQTHHQCPHLIFVILVFDLRILRFGFGFSVFAVGSPLGLRSKDLGLGFLLWLWWSLFAWIFWWWLWFWLRTVCRFGFLIHSDFLVEVVVVLRAVGGGGRSCGFLGLPLVVVELG